MSATIYKIYSTSGDKVYIGSTTTSLTERFRCHRNNENPGTSRILFDEYGVENCMIESLEEVKEGERYLRERHWIETTSNVVNERIPGRVGNERYIVSYEKHKEKRLVKAKVYKEANKDRCKEVSKKWHEANKEHMKEWKKEYNSARVNCEICGVEVCRGALFRHKKVKH
jgi:hypothetical protein